MEKNSVLIIGAGISGLIAARILIREGIQVGILEARERIGGRIMTFRQGEQILEGGPEFIHGRLKETLSLLKEYRIPFVKTAGKAYYFRSGHFVENMEDDWDMLIKKMKTVKTDLPFMQFLLENFEGEEFRNLRESAIGFAEGFDLADVHTVSTISLIREWEIEESTQYRIPGGYGQIMIALADEFTSSGGRLFLNRPVAKLKWSKGRVEISTTDNHKFRADKVIITIPVAVLNHFQNDDYDVSFSPDILTRRVALRQIGFGTAIKVLLQWKTAFWKTIVPDAQFIFSDKDIPTWWTQSPADTNVLTGWVGGRAAEGLSEFTEKELLNIAIENLSSMFGMQPAELNAQLLSAKCVNWKKEIFTRGAYSYTLAGQEAARAIWKEPLEKTLYFAGEACYQGPHGGTVEAAIISGMETARELLKEYKTT